MKCSSSLFRTNLEKEGNDAVLEHRWRERKLKRFFRCFPIPPHRAVNLPSFDLYGIISVVTAAVAADCVAALMNASKEPMTWVTQ